MGKNFEQLEVWKNSCRLAVDTYRAFDNVKDYGLVNQITRSAVSVPSNIAEGSIAEFRTQAYIAGKLKLISSEDAKKSTAEAILISKMLQNLITSIKDSNNSI